MRVIVFGAHPDDETLGCGGTIYRHFKRGDEVMVVCVTDGSGGALEIEPRELAAIREGELREACKTLGVKKVKFLGFKDGYLSIEMETLDTIGQIIRSEKPDRIYVHHGDSPPGEDNPDHINTHRLVLTAVKRGANWTYPQMGKEPWITKEVYAFEVPTYPLQRVTSYVNITDEMAVKLEGLRKFKSQTVHANLEEVVQSLNRWRGMVGKAGKFAEAFRAIRTSIL